MIKNLNFSSSVFRAEVDLSKISTVKLPPMITYILLQSTGLASSAGSSGICRIEGDVVSDTAYQTTYTAGVGKVANGSFSSFGIYLNTQKVKGTYAVANNVLSFTPATSVNAPQDACVTCALTSSPTIGGVEVNKSVRFIQAKTTGTSPINLGIVEQTTGSSIAGELIIHNQFSGLAYPQSSTFIVNKALSAGKVVLKSGLPLGNCEKSLNEVGSLRLKLVPSTSSTAISKSLLPKNRSSSVYFDVYSIDKSSGEIVVNDPAGLISGASGTVFFAGLYAQGGHANTQLINNMFGGGIEGLPSITIKESALAGKTASLTLRRDISLDM